MAHAATNNDPTEARSLATWRKWGWEKKKGRKKERKKKKNARSTEDRTGFRSHALVDEGTRPLSNLLYPEQPDKRMQSRKPNRLLLELSPVYGISSTTRHGTSGFHRL